MLARVAADLFKFFPMCKQAVEPNGELAGPLYPVTCMPAFLNQMAESTFVAGRGVEHQDR